MLLTILQTPEDKERLETLQKEIQSKLPTPVVDREPDHSWLGDTCVRSGSLRVSEYLIYCPNSLFLNSMLKTYPIQIISINL